MAVLKDSNWYIRAGGAETNGGGYDAVNYPGGTNYADQDSPQLSLTDLVSTASTTVASAAAGFTSAMVGNCLRIASASGTPTTGYYFIVSYTDASTVVLDRVSGTYTAGVAKVGGAHASLLQYANGGLATQPVLATPLIAGNTVNIRGAGTDDPSTVDYNYSANAANYWTYPSGDTTNGYIKFVGYNGRPYINNPTGGLMVYNTNYHWLENIKFKANGASYAIPNWGCRHMSNCYFDTNGTDSAMLASVDLIGCYIYNSGGTTAGTNVCFDHSTYGGVITNNYFLNVRGYIQLNYMSNFRDNIVSSSKVTAKGAVYSTELGSYSCTISGNTIYNCAGSGIELVGIPAIMGCNIFNNILANNGAYGIKFPSGTAFNDLHNPFCDYNAFYSNTSGTMQNKTAGAHDVTSDPTFTAAGSADFSVGTNMKAVGYPSLITKSGTTTYIDIGAAQRVEPTGGGGGGDTIGWFTGE